MARGKMMAGTGAEPGVHLQRNGVSSAKTRNRPSCASNSELSRRIDGEPTIRHPHSPRSSPSNRYFAFFRTPSTHCCPMPFLTHLVHGRSAGLDQSKLHMRGRPGPAEPSVSTHAHRKSDDSSGKPNTPWRPSSSCLLSPSSSSLSPPGRDDHWPQPRCPPCSRYSRSLRTDRGGWAS